MTGQQQQYYRRPVSLTRIRSAPSSLPQFILLAFLAFICLSSDTSYFFKHNTIPGADAALAIRVNATMEPVNFRSWDPFQGEAEHYTLSGLLMMGDVMPDCTIQVNPAVGPSGQLILNAVDPANPIVDSIIVLRYDWLDNCATFDDIFNKLSTLNDLLKTLALPEVGAVVMDGDANSMEDFGSPFNQLANANYWNNKAHLNISYTGSDSVLSMAALLSANGHTLLATVEQDQGPWNHMWRSIGFNILIRGLDVLTGIVFAYGIWVMVFIIKADKHDSQHFRRYMILIPGCFYLPLSIAFAPYKVTVPWRNALYYVSLLFPFISLGLQMIMWSKLIYRINRKKTNKFFSYYSYFSIFIPVFSSFMDGLGWLIPSVPIIRIIGERGFSYLTPAVILLQACLIFYYAITFFKSLKGVAVSQTTRTALVKITVLNLAMISFFILMFLSRIISLLGLNMKSRAAYITELTIFRFSFVFFYAACFRTLSIRQPSGSTVDSKGNNSTSGAGADGGKHSKNVTVYPMDNLPSSSHNGNRSQTGSKSPTGEDRPSMHYNLHLSNHASKGFTISDPNSLSSVHSSNIIPGPRLTHGYSQSQHQLLDSGRESSEYVVPDPYKFNEFGNLSATQQFNHSYTSPNLTKTADHAAMGGLSLSPRLGGATPARGLQSVSPSPATLEDEMGYGHSNDEDKDSVYGSHRTMHGNGGQKYNGGNGGRVVGGLGRNSEGYARFDISDEERAARAV
ncbi:hypothetical protein EC957_012180 [Mortierella hygrophila]|uniref:Uncharacterized protein n=1 Tax=Mortierella hygrophila TaxID=979708 RepID=A0A9P6F7T2_9FUNG|nr:hypothetical protein EC957_012180 [Mortierella hygrophila]